MNGTSLRPGQRCTVRITDLAFGGEGVGRIEQFVVFVPFVLPEESVEVEITTVKKSFARARLLRVIEPSAQRVAPRCRYYGECGGCQYQHVAYETQLRLKHKQVTDLLERVGKFPAALVQRVIPCPQPYGYRNRLMVRSQWDKVKRSLNIGFLRYDCRLVVDVEECPIAEAQVSEQIQKVRAQPPSHGGLKVVLRLLPNDWEVPPDSFFQNNFHLLPALVSTVRARLLDSGVRHLVDLYCGVGFFALELADAVESYHGVELDPAAVKAARRNAARKHRLNGEFLAAPAEACLPTVLGRLPAERTAVLLDPPRVGCAPAALRLLRESRPAQVLYVSCHPATLARDLNVLCADGVYCLVQVAPLDMFPQTQHVECVADLRRAGEGGGGGSAVALKPN